MSKMRVAGLMSGTSVDGIDVALVEIEGEGFEQQVRLLAYHDIPFPEGVRESVLGVSNAKTETARISQMHFLLGELFAEALVEACRRSGLALFDLDLVGSHGQTIYHQATPAKLHGRAVRSTLQIGEASIIAARVRAPVVSDFRPADLALGGQGAPLVPYVDYLLYRRPDRGRVALNIGGISNITAIPPGAESEQVIAFDTGPGNMLIDALVSQFSRGTLTFDRDGRMAAAGAVRQDLLSDLLNDHFLHRPPPKSCGREQYGPEYVARLLGEGLEPADLVATATAFTAASVTEAIERFVAPRMPVDELIVSGGGVKNPEILKRLRAQAPETKVLVSDELGVQSDAKEALAFAVLAHETWHRRAANLPSATGAKGAVVLGKVSYPPV